MGLLVFIIVIVTVLGVVYLSKQDFIATQEPVKKVPEIDESQLNDDLSSSSDIDYRKLRLLLASSLFEEADLETKYIFGCLMYPKYVSKWNAYEDNTYLLSRIPRIDLLTINELWAKYSKGRFSFSVQANIFDKIYIDLINEMTIKNEEEKFGMTKETIQATVYFDAWPKFAEKVGWGDDVVMYRDGYYPNALFGGAYKHLSVHQNMLALIQRLKKIS